MKAKKQIYGMTPYQPGKPIEEVKKELGLSEVIKLASNENPHGASERVKHTLEETAALLEIYPDGYAAALRKKTADFLGVKGEQLVFGAGSDEVILMLCRTFLDHTTNTVMATPSFSQYKHNALIEGAEIREVPLREGVHDLDAMLEAIDEQTRIVWVCNPNNPSGTYVDDKAFRKFVEQVPEHVLIVSDEAYIEYVTANDYPQTMSMLSDTPNLMLLRTFSKAYGMASLRVGFGIASEELISLVDRVRPPFNLTTTSQVAAIEALEDQEHIRQCVKDNAEGLEELQAFCRKHDLTYLPTQANFLLIYVKVPGDIMFNALLKKGFIVRSGQALGFPEAIRVTIGTKEQNKAFMTAFAACLEEVNVSSK